jgi:hypothetical protein
VSDKTSYRTRPALRMSDLLTIEASGALSTERRERMQRQARASKADATWAAYAADWCVWEAWAARTGATVFPAVPEHVAVFLSDMSASRKISTLRRYLASISVAHSLRGLVFDRKHAAITTILKGIARESSTPVRRVKPLLAARVRSLLADMGDTSPTCAMPLSWRSVSPRAVDARSWPAFIG